MSGSAGSTGGGPVPTSDVTITNNNVNHVNTGFNPGTSDFPLSAIYVSGDNQGTAGRLNVDVRGNTVPAGASFNFLGTMIEVFEYTGPDGDLHLVDNPVGPGGQTATQQLQSTNTGSASASAGVALDVTGALPQPPDLTPLPLHAANGGVQASSPTPGETHLTQAQLDSMSRRRSPSGLGRRLRGPTGGAGGHHL